MIIFSLHHNFISELKIFKSRFVMDSPRCFCKFVIIICNSCFHHLNSSGENVCRFSPNSDSHHSGEICVMSMLLMFRVCHNSQYNSYQSCFLVKTKISSNCPAMFHVIIVWSHYLPIFRTPHCAQPIERYPESMHFTINLIAQTSLWLYNNFIASSSSVSLYSSGCQFGGGFGIMKLLWVCCWCTFIICWLFNVFSNVFNA